MLVLEEIKTSLDISKATGMYVPKYHACLTFQGTTEVQGLCSLFTQPIWQYYQPIPWTLITYPIFVFLPKLLEA